MRKIFIIGLMIITIFLSSCSNMSEKDRAINECIDLCINARDQGLNLSNGPCLSDLYSFNVNDYVCDVAHNPRKSIDNRIENQCKEFRNGLKNHFIEVDENCSLIRVY